MKIVYIKQLEEIKNKNFYETLKYRFNIIDNIKHDQIRNIFYVPRIDKVRAYSKINKMIKNMKESNVKIVLENSIKTYKEYFKEYYIIDGTQIKRSILPDILEYIYNHLRKSSKNGDSKFIFLYE